MEIYCLPKITLPWWDRWWELLLLPLDFQKFSHSWPRGSLKYVSARSGSHGIQLCKYRRMLSIQKPLQSRKMCRSPFISHSRTTEHCPGQWHHWVLGLFRNLWKAAFIGLALRCPILDKLHHPGGPASRKPVHVRDHFWRRGISGLAHQSWIGDCLVAVADLAGVNYLLSRVEVLMNSRHSASGSESKDPRFWR